MSINSNIQEQKSISQLSHPAEELEQILENLKKIKR
jgi:hypothetical protein